MVLTGISGMFLGDGAGGKIALSIKTNVLRILSDTHLSFMTATIKDIGQTKTGTVSYYVPEIIKTKDYGTGTNSFQTPQSGLVSVNIDKRKDAKFEIETFDISRLSEATYIIGMISAGLAMSIQATLNAEFLDFLKNEFKGNLVANKIELDFIGVKDKNLTPENARKDLLGLEYQLNDIEQMFDKAKIGVPKAEVMCILAPLVDTNIRYAFWNQPNNLGEWVISKTLSGKQIGNIKYIRDTMLNKNIAAGTSFSEDKEYDFSKILGVMLHNEAVAMPINFNEVIQVINPNNGNPRWIAKFQFGIGILRKDLLFYIVKKGDALK